MRFNKYNYAAVFLLLFFISALKAAGQTKGVTVQDIGWGNVDIGGFSLTENAKVKISGTGKSYGKRGGGDAAYGWILNADTRTVVWSLLDDDEFYDRRGRVIDFEREITLEKGNYEVYFTYGGNYNNDGYDFGDFLEDLFTFGRRYRDSRGNRNEDFHLTVSGPENIFTPNNGTDYADKKAEGAIVSIIRTRDNKHIKKGFTLSGDTKVLIYMIGEARNGEDFDYGWITDVKTNKRIWVIDSEVTEHAGGGRKNVLVNKEVVLPAGSYMAYFVTDDSHSYREWNVMPPNDPQFWGITIWAASKDDYAKVKPFKEEDVAKPVIQITRVRDDENISQGFSLNEPMDLRILCMGESGHDDMADYGWIINADTRETVWQMENRITEHAGGADKNRMIDVVLHFDKGNYIAYYTTDDSHAYRDWNSLPPFDPEQWGITIWTVNEKDFNKVKTFEERDYKSKDIIAQIIKGWDNERIKKSFSLNKETKIRIYAFGEGEDHDLADYGWIKNDETRKVVWDMNDETTDNAGGSQKNRMFNGTITLPKGNYTLFYETDDSHSYRDWNDDLPRDPDMYGITLYYE